MIFKVTVTTIALALLTYVAILKVQTDSRSKRIVSLEKQLEEWRKVTKLKFNKLDNELVSNLRKEYILEMDSTTNHLVLKPTIEIDDFFGFQIQWDTTGIVSIQEFKP